MRKNFILSVCISLLAHLSTAQTISFTGFGGYTFQDKVSFSNAYGYIRESGHWGLSVEGINREGHGVELLFQHQSTRAPLYDYNSTIALNPEKNDLNISYLVLNGVGYLKNNSMIWPYGGLGFGAAFINASGKDLIDEPYDRSQTKFTWDIKAGIKIKTHSVVGIKIQAQLFSIVQASGGGFYTGSGGSGGYVSSFSTIYQFGLTGGLTFDFEQK